MVNIELDALEPPRHPADFEHWARADNWSLRECALLLFEEDPRFNTPQDILVRARPSRPGGGPGGDYGEQRASVILGLEDLCKRSFGRNVDLKIDPIEFLEWAKGKGYEIPGQLEVELAKYHSAQTDWKVEVHSLKLELKQIKAERDGLVAQLEVERKATLPNAESPYWREFQQRVLKAVSLYRNWSQRQKKVQKSSNLHEWILNEIEANTREAEIIKKVLSDIYEI